MLSARRSPQAKERSYKRVSLPAGGDPPPTIIRLTEIYSPGPPRLVYRRKIRRVLTRLGVAVVTTGALLLFALTFGRTYLNQFIGEYKLASPIKELSGMGVSLTELPLPAARSRGKFMHRVRGSETWDGVLKTYDVNSETIEKVEAELKRLDRLSLKRGQVIYLSMDDSGLVRLQTRTDTRDEIVLKSDLSSRFRGRVSKFQQELRERVLLAEISVEARSFSQAAEEAGVSYDVVDELVDLFGDKINFRRDFRLGDRFSVIFREQLLAEGGAYSPGPIMAAAISVNGRRFVAIRYVGSDGKARYFDDRGNWIENTFLRYPLKFSRISSEFTYARFHPVLKVSRPHNGVDFAAPVGTPVRTIGSGIVTVAGYKGGNGNMVQIKHSERYDTLYLHLSKIAPGIKSGTRVNRGDLIGAVGATGLATGPHLHFSFLDNGNYVNPLKMDLPSVDELSKEQVINAQYLARALFTLDRYQAMDFSALAEASSATRSE